MSCTVTPSSSTGQGFFILPNPEIDFCVANNCFQHCVTTGNSGYLYNDSVLESLSIQNINLTSPEHFESDTPAYLRTGVYYGLIPVTDASIQTGVEMNFLVEDSGMGHFDGGFIKTEASLALDLSQRDTWSVDFWINIKEDYTGIENAPFKSKDVTLFGVSGEYPAENGNTFFNIGYTLESGFSGISGLTKTVKPYADFSGIQSDENYFTGFFYHATAGLGISGALAATTGEGWDHFAFVKEYTGYSTYLNGQRVGKVIPKDQLDPYIPSGYNIFYFGGLPSGKFGSFNTGQNQQFQTGSDVDLLLHFNNDLTDSGRYEQTIVSGGHPVFDTDSKYGDHSINFTGLEYIETSGEHFNYGTGDFTIECWIKPSGMTKGFDITGNAVQTLWALGKDSATFTTGNGIALLLNYHTNHLRLAFAPDNQEMQIDLYPPFKPTEIEIGEWNHIALQRENNVFYSFINGIPAGAFGDSDFAKNKIISQHFTGNPVFDFGADQKFFLGGAMEGSRTTFVVPTGDLYASQPNKLLRGKARTFDFAGTDQSAGIEIVNLGNAATFEFYDKHITYTNPKNTTTVPTSAGFPLVSRQNIVGQAHPDNGVFFVQGSGSKQFENSNGSGYKYTYNCPPDFTGDLYMYASCTSRWGRSVNANGTSTSVARVFRNDVEEQFFRWEHGGDSVYSDDPRYSPNKDFLIGAFTNDTRFNDGIENALAFGLQHMGVKNNTVLGPAYMSGCYSDVFIPHKMAGFTSGDVCNFVCHRYGNEGNIPRVNRAIFFPATTSTDGRQIAEQIISGFSISDADFLANLQSLRLRGSSASTNPKNSSQINPFYYDLGNGGPDDPIQQMVRFYNSKKLLKLPLQMACGPDIVHINSLIFKQTLVENFVGQIDELRISSGVARYSNSTPTGIYDSGFLNSDLGRVALVDNITLSRMPVFHDDNGAYEIPSSGNTGIYSYDFDTPIDLGNIVTNGITGQGGAGTELKTYEVVGFNTGVNVRFTESGYGKFGDYAIRFPTGQAMMGSGSAVSVSGNFLYSEPIDFNTGDFTVEFWFKPSGNSYAAGKVSPPELLVDVSGNITGTGQPETGVDNSGELNSQTIFAIGDYTSGFNIFLTGSPEDNVYRIGLNISNGPDLLNLGTGSVDDGIFDENQEPVGSERMYFFGDLGDIDSFERAKAVDYGANSYWKNPEHERYDEWNHLAFSRKDRNFYLYLNGRFAGNINYTGIVMDTGINGLTGITSFSGYNLYLESNQPNESTVFEDSITIAGKNGLPIRAFGGITHSTEQRVIGSSSIYFNGYNQYLSLPTFPDYGTGDFTMEGWVWPQDVGAIAPIFASVGQEHSMLGKKNAWAVSVRKDGVGPTEPPNKLQAYWFGQNRTVTGPNVMGSTYYLPGVYGGPEVPTGQWSHVAVCREDGVIKLFINGEFMNSSLEETANNQSLTATPDQIDQYRRMAREHEIKQYTSSVTIGRFYADRIASMHVSGLYYYKGYMDGLKLSDNARFTGEKIGDTNPVSSFSGAGLVTAADVEAAKIKGLTNDDYTRLQHIGPENYYITGVTGCHDMNISGRMVFGGGCHYMANYQGEIDAINVSFDTPYTGIYTAPKPLKTCSEHDLLSIQFDKPSGSVYFEDSHCCATGVEGTGRWGEIIGINGSGFFDVTGILFGENRVPSKDWFVPEREYINAIIPNGALSGPTIILGSGYKEVTGCHLEIIPVDTEIYGFSPASGVPNDTITVSGQTLSRFENLFIFDNTGERLQLPFTRVDETGITFTIPTGVDCNLPTHTDFILSGKEQFITGNASGEIRTGSLRINSSGIKSVSVGSGVFGEEVSFSGSYFNSGVDIPMFPAYQTGVSIYDPEYVQTNYVPALDIEYIGVTGITAKVPKEIVHGDLILSGSGLSGAGSSDPTNPDAIVIVPTVVNINCGKQFVPIPTITGVTKTLYKNGSSFVITGVNACYIHPYIGFTGSNAQAFHNNSDPVNQNVHSQVSFIANSGNAEEYLSGLNSLGLEDIGENIPNPVGDGTSGYNDIMYNGNIFINKDQLDINYPESSKTGFVIISGFINSTTIGTGNPFLVSAKEINNGEYYDSGDYGISGFKDNFFNTGSFVYARDNISSVTGDQIEISGNCPDFSGIIQPDKGDEETIVLISGIRFANLTGVKIEASDGTDMCHVSTGDFVRFVEIETGIDPETDKIITEAVRTGHHFSRFYQGTGNYINPIDWINSIKLKMCPELKDNGNVTVSPLYDSGICTTGII